MQPVIILLVLFSFSVAGACPTGTPNGFQLLKKVGKSTLFINSERTATIGFKCESLSKADSYSSLQYLKNRTVLDEATSYTSLKNETDFVSRIYFRVTDGELVQSAVTATLKGPEDLKRLEEAILDFQASP